MVQPVQPLEGNPLRGTVASEGLERVHDGSFDLSAGLGAGYRFSDTRFVALGVGYSRNYGKDEVFPRLALLWRPTDHCMLTLSPDGVVPAWRINDDWRLRMKVELLGRVAGPSPMPVEQSGKCG